MKKNTPEEGKKVLMVIGLFHPFLGGAERECRKIARGLREKGVAVAVLTQHSDHLPDYEVIDGVPVYRKMKGWHWFEISYMLSVLRFLFHYRQHYDIIQCFGLYLFIPPAIVVRYLLGKKVVARLECSGRFGDFWRIGKLRWGGLVMAGARRCDALIYISEEIRKELVANSFPPEKLVYLTNSVDTGYFRPPARRGGEQRKVACFVGRLEEQKGVEYLLEAMVQVREREPAVTLIVVGDGRRRSRLERLRSELGLKDHVFLVGAFDDVLPYYQAATLFVLPSLSEGLPLSLLEAMSCGLPVVVTRVGGNSEIVAPAAGREEMHPSGYCQGSNGLLVEPRDVAGLAEALLKLFGDESLSRRLGRQSRRLAEERFSQGAALANYLALYGNLGGAGPVGSTPMGGI